jgi:hypothetical protein
MCSTTIFFRHTYENSIYGTIKSPCDDAKIILEKLNTIDEFKDMNVVFLSIDSENKKMLYNQRPLTFTTAIKVIDTFNTSATE